jgi:TM2 domain-containing membrane protein YozV
MTTEDNLFLSLTEQQRPLFAQEMARYRKDEVLGVFIAILFGWFGGHQFYLKRNGLGILYACFFWTGIPAIASFVEAFFMPLRVQRYNEELATLIYMRIVNGPVMPVTTAGTPAHAAPALAAAITPPMINRSCAHCGAVIAGEASYCPACGTTAAA